MVEYFPEHNLNKESHRKEVIAHVVAQDLNHTKDFLGDKVASTNVANSDDTNDHLLQGKFWDKYNDEDNTDMHELASSPSIDGFVKVLYKFHKKRVPLWQLQRHDVYKTRSRVVFNSSNQY